MSKKHFLITAIALSTAVSIAGLAAEQTLPRTETSAGRLLLAQQAPSSPPAPLPGATEQPEAQEGDTLAKEPSHELTTEPSDELTNKPSDDPAGFTSEQTTIGPIVTEQTAGQLQADKLIGMDAVNDQEEHIGSIHDLIVESDGRVVAAVLSVGGFLGLGEKLVGVAWDRITIQPEQQNVLVPMSKEQLENMPEFKTLEVVRAERKQNELPSGTGVSPPAAQGL